MSAEVLATGIGLTIAVITLGVTIHLTNRSTQKIIREGQENTQKLLDRIIRVQESMNKCLIKIDKGLMANAMMHGWGREDNITPEHIDSLPEPKVFDKDLGFCYYKPKSE